MKKRMLSLLICLVMVISLFQTAALAAGTQIDQTEIYLERSGAEKELSGITGLYVNGEQFTDEKTEIACGAGKATYDPALGNLTLDNAEITQGDGSMGAIRAVGNSKLTITLVGYNKIEAEDIDGITAEAGIELAGSGKLEISVVGDECSGISTNGSVVFKGSGDLASSASISISSPDGPGIAAGGKVIIDSVEIVIYTKGDGIFARSLIIKNKSKVNDLSGIREEYGIHIYDPASEDAKNPSVEIIDSIVQIQGQPFAIYSTGSITISGGRVMALARGERYPSRDELKEVCCRQAEHRFAGKASRINTQFSWDDLVLPEASKELLRDLCSRNKNREQVYGSWNFASRFPYGLGTSILFTGSPGTGKTMAAQVMAKELDLELFRVNLSAVVSKYVGETEKNLNQIFDEASKSLCILFFDEADVLFGKRTEVKDSQDKYQNMEAAFLLQKMEEYDGVSILATNYQQNIDEAFKRRIQYVVEFPLPGAQERLGMWRRAFPKECPVQETVDLQFLAEQFELTGSNIKNIAVNAAFLAASDEEAVGMQQILRALRNEYRKSGKRLTASELGPYGGSVQG